MLLAFTHEQTLRVFSTRQAEAQAREGHLRGLLADAEVQLQAGAAGAAGEEAEEATGGGELRGMRSAIGELCSEKDELQAAVADQDAEKYGGCAFGMMRFTPHTLLCVGTSYVRAAFRPTVCGTTGTVLRHTRSYHPMASVKRYPI